MNKYKWSSASFQLWKAAVNIVLFVLSHITRGEEVSRPLKDILNEIITKGVSEITLLGQNVNAIEVNG